MADSLTLGLLCDFNSQNLALLLEKNSSPNWAANCLQAPYGQTVQLLHEAQAEFWSMAMDALVVWTFPEQAIPSFQRVLSFEQFSLDELMAEVDAFAALLQRIPQRIQTIIVPTWVVPGMERGFGTLELVNGVGITNTLMRMNLRLADAFGNDRRFVLLDSQRWVSRAGAAAFSPSLWYVSKTPFHTTVFQEASQDMIAAINGIKGRNKRVLVLDLDDTLWGGIVGEVGWEKLRLGGHDPIGEAFVDFQRSLKRLVNRGILLGVVSKNEEAVALEAIRKHPEMVLKLGDFAGWRINWQDKAANIADLMAGLNLGIDSALFLDDSPFERARVKEALPQVLVPDFPADPLQYVSFLRGLRCFDSSFVTQEDRSRTSMYVADRQRSALKAEVGSLGDWLELLQVKVEVEPLAEANLDRTAQLFNKTNQMNLSTRRLPPGELLEWSRAEGHCLWVFRVTDKFGEYGICGIASLEQEGRKARLADFLLSCRVMGRGVEETMLCTAARRALDRGCNELFAEYRPTPKNQPCEKWLEKQSQLVREANVFRMPLNNSISFPRHVRVSVASTCEAEPAETIS